MRRTIAAATIWALLLGLPLRARADDAHLVPRVFAITPSSAACPDLLASDSIAVLTASAFLHTGTYVFADRDANIITDECGNVILDLRNTVWDLRPVMHVTNSGIVNYSCWWQRPDDDVDTPPGIACLTGPGGNVLMQLGVLIKQINDGADPDDGEYVVVTSSADVRLCVAVGLCNK